MVRQILLLAGVAVGMTAFADNQTVNELQNQTRMAKSVSLMEKAPVVAKMNDGSNSVAKSAKAAGMGVQWKRPAGQFWGMGYSPETGSAYYFTPLVVRPWVDYKFENISTAKGTPTWNIEQYDSKTQDYVTSKSNEKDVTVQYVWGETPGVPLLSYPANSKYAQMYDEQELITKFPVNIVANKDIKSSFGASMPVSSHYYGFFTRHKSEGSLIRYTGAKDYSGKTNGNWFGTNAQGINAQATRFEKPDQPYLLNSVYWFYGYMNNIPTEIPLKAYVFNTENDAAEAETTSGAIVEIAELGDLIAVSEAVVPVTVYDKNSNGSDLVEFKFYETNPVTGAKTEVSLEIEDDIIVVVTGFDADLGNGGFISSMISQDQYDEGYGNLGFLGSMEVSEDGTMSYALTALKNFFSNPLPNTTLGVLADVTYPWLVNGMGDMEFVRLANDGETTETNQGLSYQLILMSTSETADFEITFDGKDECDWLSITDLYDDYEINKETGEDEFTGMTMVEFTANPNPNDESRTCKVKVSIPAASYEIDFLQGSKAEGAVDVVVTEGDTQYFDLAGRRVMNPEKGLYIKVNGNKAEKVIR